MDKEQKELRAQDMNFKNDLVTCFSVIKGLAKLLGRTNMFKKLDASKPAATSPSIFSKNAVVGQAASQTSDANTPVNPNSGAKKRA
jgi:predicted nuclease of restriction endonuclease-like RecB superfamily